jgi:aspartate/methionine/tyrosine aminotransferase
MKFSDQVTCLEPEGAYHMLARAQALEASGRQVIHLEIGQPDMPTFENIAAAGVDAIRGGRTRYTPSAGLNDLRHVVAEDAGRRRGVELQSGQVVIGPGAKPALFFTTLVLVRPGDEVIYPDPGFPTYKAMIEVADGVPVPVPLSEEDDFSFDMAAFKGLISQRTRLVVINSPSNPTGGVIPPADLAQIADRAVREDFWVLSDEIYSRLVYGAAAPSIYSLPGMAERTVICDGFSKTYAMTGWRLGYGIMPLPLAEKVALLQNHSLGSTAEFTQIAGIEALLGDQSQVEAVVAEYQRRRDLVVAGLNLIPGVSCRVPQGAFYAFPNIKAFGRKSEWLADYLLEEAGVALLPGTAFGACGEGYLRICFANSIQDLQRALERISTALNNLAPG